VRGGGRDVGFWDFGNWDLGVGGVCEGCFCGCVWCRRVGGWDCCYLWYLDGGFMKVG